MLFIQGVLPIGAVILSRELVDSLVAAAGTGAEWEVVRRPLMLALVMAGLLLTGELIRALTQWVRTCQTELVSDHVRGLIHARAASLDLAFYESSDYFDKLHRARVDAQVRPSALVESMGSLLQSALTLVAMAGVLVTFGWWLPLALLCSTLPAFLVVMRFVVRQHGWFVRTTEDQRRTAYYEQVLTSREAFPEVRLFGLAGHFRQLFLELRQRLRGERLALARSEAGAQVLAGLFALGVMGATLGWMVVQSVRGSVSLGELAMFYQAFSQGQKLMRTLLETVGQIYSNSLFLGNLFEFLGLQPSVLPSHSPVALPARLQGRIDFRSVGFTYPGCKRPVYTGFDLSVPAGSVVALLGRNGAGKSTLFKLLCRFYDPDVGSIELAGNDLRSVDPEELRRRIAVLFQEPMHFIGTVRRNIAYGDLAGGEDDERIVRAARAAGAEEVVAGLDQGSDTLLGRWFGGAEISVGEWQRIALARCFVRDADIILLDEPTSAMDSWSEADWMERLLAMVSGRTTILITHRLTTAMRADVIHVMEAGRVIESGSHAELLGIDSRYAAAWRAQLAGAADPAQLLRATKCSPV